MKKIFTIVFVMFLITIVTFLNSSALPHPHIPNVSTAVPNLIHNASTNVIRTIWSGVTTTGGGTPFATIIDNCIHTTPDGSCPGTFSAAVQGNSFVCQIFDAQQLFTQFSVEGGNNDGSRKITIWNVSVSTDTSDCFDGSWIKLTSDAEEGVINTGENTWNNFSFANGSYSQVDATGIAWRFGWTDVGGGGQEEALYEMEVYGEAAPPTASFGAGTPVNNTFNNTFTGVLINVTCNLGDNASVWFGNDTDPINEVALDPTNATSWNLNSTVINTERTYFYKGGCNQGRGGVTNTSVRQWTFDNSTPTITINAGTFFSLDNFSNQFQYNNTISADIGFADETLLFGYFINLTLSDVSCFNFTNTSVTGTTSNFTGTLNITGCGSGLHDIELLAADGHTKKKIKDYDVTKKNKEVKFKTEKNTIWIESNKNAQTDAIKVDDRYNFQFDFGSSSNPQKKFKIKSYTPITYIESGLYQGWFVVWDGRGGNWIDFEGIDMSPNITQMQTKKEFGIFGKDVFGYEIVFNTNEDVLLFNSIGTLNTLQRNFTWFRGIASTAEGTNLTGAVINLTLTLTTDQSISSISADLIHNNTEFLSPTLTNTTSLVTFKQQVSLPNVTTSVNITYVWNITVTQGNGNTTTGNFTRTQQIEFFDLDNCTLYSTEAINFSFQDEGNQSKVDMDVTLDFNFTIGTTTKRFLNTMTARNNFSICITPENLEFTADYLVQYDSATYGARRFRNTSQTLDSSTQNIILFGLELAEGIFARFQTLDQFENVLTDVLGVMRRQIGGVFFIMESEITDSGGLATFFVDPDQDYQYTFSKTGFPNTVVTLRRTDTNILPIIMGKGLQQQTNGSSDGIKFTQTPFDTVLNNNTNVFFAFNLTSSFWTITNCTLRLELTNGTILQQSNNSFGGSICNIGITQNTGNFTQIISRAIFEENNSNIVVLTKDYLIIPTYVGQFSLKVLLDDIKAFNSAGFNSRSQFLFVFIAIFIITVIVNMQVEFPNPEGSILLVLALVFLFSFVGMLTITLTGMPTSPGFETVSQWIVFIIMLLFSSGYIIWRHT